MAVTIPKQARSRKTFDGILDAASQILLTAGIEGLNTNETARLAEVNIATLYRYFDDKYDLVDGLLARFSNLQLERIAQEMKRFSNPGERLERIIDLQLELLDEHPWMPAIHSALRASPRLQAIRQANKQYMSSMVLQRLGNHGANARGPFLLGERQESSTQLLVEVFGMGLGLLAEAPEHKRAALKSELLTMLNAYLDTMTTGSR